MVELPSLGTLSRIVSCTILLYVRIQSAFVDADLETCIKIHCTREKNSHIAVAVQSDVTPCRDRKLLSSLERLFVSKDRVYYKVREILDKISVYHIDYQSTNDCKYSNNPAYANTAPLITANELCYYEKKNYNSVKI